VAKTKRTTSLEQNTRDLIKLQQELNELQKESEGVLSRIFYNEEKRKNLAIDIENAEVKYQKLRQYYQNNSKYLTKKKREELKKEITSDKERVEVLKKQNKLLDKQVSLISTIGNISKSYIIDSYTYLNDLDSVIKTLNLSMGLSSVRTEILRNNFSDTLKYSSLLGSSAKELAESYSIYTNETGRATLLSERALKTITQISKGTGIGAQNAGLLAAKYELVGVSVENSLNYIQGIVDTSERMGVNLSKVMKNLNENFFAAQKFNFRTGVQGIADMAMNSAKFNQDMLGVFNAADKARSLEGVVEMAAKLQVLGGQFANSNPFEMLFESRNDPDKFAKSLTSMLSGLATYNKELGQFQITALDRDRLRLFADATGQSYDDLIKQALRLGEVNKINQQTSKLGFSKADRELISSFARMGDKGTFEIQVGSSMIKLSDLTQQSIQALKQEQISLEKRAELTQTFDQSLKIFKEQFKLALLPLLEFSNKYILPMMININKFISEGDGVATKLLSAAGIITGAVFGLKALSWLKNLSLDKMFGGTGANNLLNPKALLAKSAGIAAFGVAAAGAGAGIMMASKGISTLVDSLSNLDENKIDHVKEIFNQLLIGGGILSGIILGAGALSAALPIASVGMLAFGGAITLAGIGIAAASNGLSSLVDSIGSLNKDSVDNIGNLAWNLTKLNASLFSYANIGTTAGMLSVKTFVNSLSANDFSGLDSTLNNLKSVLTTDTSQIEKVLNMIQKINSVELLKSNPISELKELLSKPLKVEFDQKDINLVVNLDAIFDSERITKKISKKIPILLSDYSNGSSSPNIL